jgi:hypothetical protein
MAAKSLVKLDTNMPVNGYDKDGNVGGIAPIKLFLLVVLWDCFCFCFSINILLPGA